MGIHMSWAWMELEAEPTRRLEKRKKRVPLLGIIFFSTARES